MERMDESALVVAARNGGQQARDELVAGYLPLVYNIVGRALNGHADVDDVVQEAMIRALDGLAGLREPARFRSWLVTITVNEIRRHWSARGTTSRPVPSSQTTGVPPGHEVADPGADFADLTIMQLELVGQRREAVAATRWLESDDRTVLSLWWLEAAGQLTRAEVAAALQLDPQHTAVRVQRVKAQLESARVVVRALDPASQGAFGGQRCDGLAAVLATWDGVPSALWRKRIVRHSRECAICSGHRRALVPAEGLLAGFALVAPVGLAAALRTGSSTAYAASATHSAPADTTAHSTYAGSPGAGSPYGDSYGRDVEDTLAEVTASGPGARSVARSRRARVRRRRRTVAAATAAILVVGGGVIGTQIFGGSSEEQPSNTVAGDGTTTPQPSDSLEPSSPTPTPSPTETESKSSSPSPSTSPEKSKTATPTPTPTPSRTTSAPPTRPASSPPAAPAGPVAQVIALVNTERAKAGCGPVAGNAKLHTAAQRHSQDMANRDYFDHVSPDGKGPSDRITAAGYQWSASAENIGMGYRDAAAAMDGWMNSPGHKANILNCTYKDIGVGLQKSATGDRWTQKFGTRR